MASRSTTVLAALILLVAALGTGRAARGETEVYRPRHRQAAELLPAVEVTLGTDGRAVVDKGSNALVMVGTPEALGSARELLAELDRALRQVEVHYARKTRSELKALGIEVRWSAEAGPVRIGNVVRRKRGAEVRLMGREEAGHEGLAGRLRVLEGHTGRIETGTLVAYETGGLWHRRTELLDVSSGFEVTPRILADGRVRLALRPFGARPTAEGRIATHDAETELVVAPDETAVLGALDQEATRSADRSLSGSSHRTEREQQLLLIRVELP